MPPLIIADVDDRAQLLGTVGLLRPDSVQRTIEISCWVAPRARGRGLAVRAVKGRTWNLVSYSLRTAPG